MNWTSYHIFIHNTDFQDEFLRSHLYPLIKRHQINEYFFIRYWQGGPHIRFRFKSFHTKEIYYDLCTELNKFRENYIGIKLDKDTFYEHQNMFGEIVTEKDLYWFEDLSIQEITYHPELERYGGPQLMQTSESCFNLSSEISLYRINKLKSNNLKFILSLDFINTLISLLPSEHQFQFLNKYSSFWSNFESSNFDYENLILQFGKLFSSKNAQLHKTYDKHEVFLLGRLFNTLKNLSIEEPEKIYSIIFSHIHMHNNRMGVPPYLESSLANILIRERSR